MSKKENSKTLDTFFSQEYTRLKSYVVSKISNSAERDAEDIIQDVALKLFSRADSLAPIQNVAGFVYNSIRNKIIDSLRVKKETTDIQDETESMLLQFMEQFYGDADNIYSEEIKLLLIKTIAELKPQYKQIIIAIDFEGYSYKELSQKLNIPEGTLMSRRHRALSMLKKQLPSSIKFQKN